jgi:hypothetical protein
MKKVVLLDIDGVLVRQGGYRAALHATLNHFASLMELPHFDFPEEKISEMEKREISSEWDMVPLLLGAFWNEILSHHPNLNLPAELSSAAVEIGRNINGFVPKNFFIPEFDLVPGLYPSEAALQSGCFPFIPLDLKTNLLSQSRNVRFSQTMRLFQHYSLGSKVFSQTYDLPAEVETESFLQTHDSSNINDAVRSKLLQADVHPAALTARPSTPPREVDTSHFGYAPESELALELVGLSEIPLIGFGKLEYLASQRGLEAGALLKPSPVHALAATAAALTGNEWAGLQSAGEWVQTGKLNGAFEGLPRKFELSVVEDTLGGIRSTQKAGEILNQAGYDVTVRAFGLTSGNAAKTDAFAKSGIPYFENWETLIEGMKL